MTDKPSKPSDLDDYAGDDLTAPGSAVPEAAGDEQTWPGWNGRSSKISVKFPVLREYSPHGYVGPNSLCVDCLKQGKEVRDHQFHAAASKVAGAWVGPEGAHLMDLKAGGYLSGTTEAA